jgi:hypothetical protein
VYIVVVYIANSKCAVLNKYMYIHCIPRFDGILAELTIAMLDPAGAAEGSVEVSRGGMADSKLVGKFKIFLEVFKKLKDAKPEAKTTDTRVTRALVENVENVLIELTFCFLDAAVKSPLDMNFADCFLDSLMTFNSWSDSTTATNRLVGPLLDLAEVMVKRKRFPANLMSQMYDAIFDIAKSVDWKDTVAQPYVPKCISLLKNSVSNWKYASQVPGMGKKVTAIMRCFSYWSDKTEHGQKVDLSDLCTDVIHKSVLWLLEKSKKASAEEPTSWTIETLGGVVRALKVPKAKINTDAAVLISYAVMSAAGPDATTFSQADAPAALLKKLIDVAPIVKSGSSSAGPQPDFPAKNLLVTRAVVNAVYLACMKGVLTECENSQHVQWNEVVRALHTCIVDVQLQDPWLSAMSACLVTWFRSKFPSTFVEQGFSQTAEKYAIEELRKCTDSKRPLLLRFLGLRLFCCHAETTDHWLQKPATGALKGETDAYTATLVDVMKRISDCVQSLKQLGPDTPMPGVPQVFEGAGWRHAKSVSGSEATGSTTLGPAWNFFWECPTGIPLIDNAPLELKDKVYALRYSALALSINASKRLQELFPLKHSMFEKEFYAAFKKHEESVVRSLSIAILTYGDAIYGKWDLEDRPDRPESRQLNPDVLTDGLESWTFLLRQNHNNLRDEKKRVFIPKDQHGSSKENADVDVFAAQFPYEFAGWGLSAAFLDKNFNVSKIAERILTVTTPLRVRDILVALDVIYYLCHTPRGAFLAYGDCAKIVEDLTFMHVEDINVSGTAARCAPGGPLTFDDPKELLQALHRTSDILKMFNQIRRCNGKSERGDCQAFIKARLELACFVYSTQLFSQTTSHDVAGTLMLSHSKRVQDWISDVWKSCKSDPDSILRVKSPKLAPRPVQDVPLPPLDNPLHESHGSNDSGIQNLTVADRPRDDSLSEPSVSTSTSSGTAQRQELPETTTLQRTDLVAIVEAIHEIERVTISYHTNFHEARLMLLDAASKVRIRLSYKYATLLHRPCNTDEYP